MLLSDLISETFSAIFANKVRSGLTMLGIIIGIGSVIAMVSIGQGAQGQIESSIQSIGSNLIIVTPGFQRSTGSAGVSAGRGTATTLTQADADAIEKEVSSITAVAPELSRRYQITARGTNTNTSVIGTTDVYPGVRNVEVDSGSFITEQHLLSLSKVAVLGPTTSNDLFGEGADSVGQKIKINKIEFTVIGATKARGGTGLGSQDDMIFVPISTAQRFLAGDVYVSTISIQATDQNSMVAVQEDVTNLLLMRHNIFDPALADFQVMNQQDIAATASTVTNTLTLLLAAIAGISIVVGGIGIMNMMLTTITERTREIGLRKAIGAKKGDISAQFLAEAIVLTFFGGAIGIALGWAASLAVSQIAGLATAVSLNSVLLAFGVSAAIGIIFGYYPARRAANLNPIEALRYE